MAQRPAIRASKGELNLRLAAGADEVEACQKLRYRVFYEELAAQPDAAAATTRIDADRFDAICDHLVVVRQGRSEAADPLLLADGELVGTYRLLRQAVAERHGGFYTQGEFDVAPMIARHPGLRFLELGRSCVLKPYRTRPVVELLWQGIWNYVRAHRLDVMFGCASLEGTDPEAHGEALTFLAKARPAPAEWRVSALPERAIAMRRRGSIDERRALRALPPLVKGYLRLGCYFGEEAVIDRQFNTIDILIILPVAAIDARYFGHFGQPNE
ncbi:MAG: GNAT family N-acetyltransferase [Rhizobiales bacterium]|nr:GNAT family N-acetyltransferase [Hyphomicrobiales bacterium]MBI3674296.1 GNAT family N-acetyltransferase [Hyphomicrobiales bacterium]